MFTLIFGLLLSTAVAYAATSDAGEQAKRTIDSIAADPQQKKLTAQPLAQARQALERASDARKAGDADHARLLDELALEWAQTAGDLVHTSKLEQESAKLEKEASEVEAKAVRALAIIEEAVARRGRVQQELDQQTAGSEAGAAPQPKAAP